jgi:MoaA/NifB/PqqE/SkfB family radical SAM enzyme
METLKKKTESLCPECLAIIPARVVIKKGNVYMEKTCHDHGAWDFIIEKDPFVYRRMMNKDKVTVQHACVKVCPDCIVKRTAKRSSGSIKVRHYCSLCLPITYACNLDCSLCYFPERDIQEPTFEQLAAIIRSYNGIKIGFTGGEPTLREDLFELIAFVRKNKKECSIATNGIKLSSNTYAKALKDAGLQSVFLSLNGLDDEIIRKIEGQDLLNIKLQAIENCRTYGFQVHLGVTLIPGVNENVLPQIYDFCLKNSDVLNRIRIRTAAPIGRHDNFVPLYLSDVLSRLSKICGIDRDKMLRKFHSSINYYNGSDFAVMLYFLKEDTGLRLVAYDPNIRRSKYIPFWKKLVYAFSYYKRERILFSLRKVKKNIVRVRIDIDCWPNKYTIDLLEAKHSPIQQVMPNKQKLPFYYAIIANDYFHKEI